MMYRINSLKELMNKDGIDASLITKPSNISYISGFTGSSGLAVITDNKNYLFTDFRYIDQAKLQCADFIVIKVKNSIEAVIYDLLKAEGIKRLWAEAHYLTYAAFKKFQTTFEHIEIICADNIVEGIRIIKDEQELENIKQAASIANNTYNYILDYIKPGMTEKQMALKIDYHMLASGADDVAFKTIVASGRNSALPHAQPTDKRIGKGEFVVLDFGCVINGYCSDMTRTVIIGKADRKQKVIYDLVLRAQNAALKYAGSNKKCSDVDMTARNIINEGGYKECFGHGLGHGVGIEVHEKPVMSHKSDDMLAPGMVVTIEPGIYVSDYGGVRIEDLIIIKEGGIINLTASPKHLAVLE